MLYRVGPRLRQELLDLTRVVGTPSLEHQVSASRKLELEELSGVDSVDIPS